MLLKIEGQQACNLYPTLSLLGSMIKRSMSTSRTSILGALLAIWLACEAGHQEKRASMNRLLKDIHAFNM